MLHEDNPDSGSREFIPTHDDDKGPSKGQRSRANWPVSRRQVCWPPKPEYGEVLPEEDSSNQVPPANQATANRTATNKSTPALLDNHTPVTQVAVNRVAAAPVNQAPPERPAAVPATTVDSNQEQPCLPPTGAKVPPPIPPRPANYPQVSMEVQQQALQQVNGQMQQQSMMNSSSSSSRQEVRSTVSQSSSSISQESTSYQATCTQQQHSYSNTQQHDAVLSGSSHHLEQEVYSNTQQQEVLQSGSNHQLEQEVYNNTQLQEAVNSEQGVSQSESSQQIELSHQQQQQEYMVQQQSESRQQLEQRRLEKQRYMAQERLEQAMAQEQLEQASSQSSSDNYMSMSMPTNSSEQTNLPVLNNSATNITPNTTHYMNGNSLVVDSNNHMANTSHSQSDTPNSTHYMNGTSLVVDSNNHMANTSHSQSDSPPVGFHITDSTNYTNQSGVYHAVPAQATGTTFGSTSGSTTVWPPQPSDVGDRPVVANGPTPTVTTQFPAGFKMRDQAPVQQTPPAVNTGHSKAKKLIGRMILSQPAFKISQPLKQKGENKWPPKGDNVVTQEQVREFTKPKGGKRDYGEFFAQNALPQTFCSYRAPPGTQHHGEDETGVSEM